MVRVLTRASQSQAPTVSRLSSHDHLSPDTICNLKHDVQKALAEIEKYEDVTKCNEDTPMFGFAVKALENAIASYREFVAKAEPDDIAIDEPNEVQRTILRWYDEYVKKNEVSRAEELKKPEGIGSSVNTNGGVMNNSEGDRITLTPLSMEADDKHEGDVAARSGRRDIGSGSGSTAVAGEIAGSVAVETAQTPRRSSRKRTLSKRAEMDAVEDADGQTEKPEGDRRSEEGDEEVDELDASDEEENEDEDAGVGLAKVGVGNEKRGEVAKKATKKRVSSPRKPSGTSNAQSKPRGSRSSSARRTSARTAATAATRARTARSRRSAGAPNAPRSRSTAHRSKKVEFEAVLSDSKSALASPSGKKTKKLRIDSTEEKDEHEYGDPEYKSRPRSPAKSPATARKTTSRAKSTPTSITAIDVDTSEAGVSKTHIPSILNTSVPVPGIPNPKPTPAATLQENIHNARLARDALLNAYTFTSGLRLQSGSKSSKPKPESGAYRQAAAKSKLYDSLKLVGLAIAGMEMMEVEANNEGLKGSQ